MTRMNQMIADRKVLTGLTTGGLTGMAVVSTMVASTLLGGGIAHADTAGLTPVDAGKVPHHVAKKGEGDTPASVATGATVNATSASSASAAASASSLCDAEYTCLWVDPSFSGGRGRFAQANPSWGPFKNAACPGGTWKNCASSAANNKSVDTFYGWTDVNYGGIVGSLNPGATAPSFPANFDNNIESNFY